jgi:Tol biopolymer transport system component
MKKISFWQEDGTWSHPKNMGERINTISHELCSIVSPDSKHLFFLSFRNSNHDVYWMDAKIIDELREK